MKKECIRVYYKRPGKNLIEVKIPNEPEWFLGAVEGGTCESVPLIPEENGLPGISILMNADRNVNGMKHNLYLHIYQLFDDSIKGPVLFVGTQDGFYTDCPRNRKQMDAFLKLKEIEARARR